MRRRRFESERWALRNNCPSGYSECVDVHRRRILVPPRRTCSLPGCECTIEDLLSKLICISRQKESAMEAMGMTVLVKVVICASRGYGFLEVRRPST